MKRVALGKGDNPIDLHSIEKGGCKYAAAQPEEIMKTLPKPHFINRWTMYLAENCDCFANGRNEDNVSALEPNVFGPAASEDVAVEVHTTEDFVMTDNPHVSHGATRGWPSCTIQRVEHGRDGRDGVPARPHDVPQYENLVGSQFSKGHVHESRRTPCSNAGVDGGESLRDQPLRLCQCEAIDGDLANVGHGNRRLARHN